MLTELALTAKDFQKTAQGLTAILNETKQQKVVSQLNTALTQVGQVANDFSAGSKNYQELTNTLMLLQESLQALKPLLKQLNNQPNSLLFEGVQYDFVEPKAATTKSQGEKE